MDKKKSGRNKIRVIESIPYSQLIFLIASGKNYALEIAKARGKEDSSPTAKQLDQLKKRGFLISKKERLLNKTLYLINWDRISQEFVSYVHDNFKREYENFKKVKITLKKKDKEINKTKEKLYPDLIRNIEDKTFETSIKRNEYLNILLKSTFSLSGEASLNKTIKEVFGDLRLDLTMPKEVFYLKEWKHSKKIQEESKKDVDYQQLNIFREICKGAFDLDTRQNLIDLDNYLMLKYTLRLYPESKIIKDLVKSLPKNIIKEVNKNHPGFKERIQEISQNSSKGTKPTENKGENAENANQNVFLSTEKGKIKLD